MIRPDIGFFIVMTNNKSIIKEMINHKIIMSNSSLIKNLLKLYNMVGEIQYNNSNKLMRMIIKTINNNNLMDKLDFWKV